MAGSTTAFPIFKRDYRSKIGGLCALVLEGDGVHRTPDHGALLGGEATGDERQGAHLRYCWSLDIVREALCP